MKPSSLPVLRLGYMDWVPFFRSRIRDHFLNNFNTLVPRVAHMRHLFCVGRTGSGKTEALKALALLRKRQWKHHGPGVNRTESLIILDPHGDFALEMASQAMYAEDFRRHPKGPDLVYLDPFLGEKPGMLPVLNPFDVWDKNFSEHEIARHAHQVMRALQTLSCGGDAPLSRNMETVLIPCITVLLHRKGSTLLDLQRFLCAAGDDLVNLGKRSKVESHRLFFAQAFGSPRFDATKTALVSRIQSLLNHSVFFRMMTGKRSSVDLEDAINSGKSVLVNCAQGRLGQDIARAIGSFVTALVLSTVLRRADRSSGKRTPTWLVMDEMHYFVSPELKTILTEARKYGLFLTLATQVVGQEMKASFTNIVLGNTAVKVVGSSGSYSRRIMAREMDVNEPEFRDLGTGQFILKSGSGKASRVQMSRCFLSGALHRNPSNRQRVRHGLMTREEWKDLAAYQLATYYRVVDASESSDFVDDRIFEDDLTNDLLPPNHDLFLGDED